MEKIIVKANEEYQVKIENEPIKGEFFYNAFCQAKAEIEEIILDKKKHISDQERKEIYNNYSNKNLYHAVASDYSNNIIAFSGDRGQGKSSAMLSFSNFLNNKNWEANEEFLGDTICSANYIILDRIDPTKFELGDNILTVILAKIFREFCKEWNVSEKSDVALRSELLEMFQTCYKEIETIKNSEKLHNSMLSLGSDLERLGRIGESANLKNDLHALIETFFKFHCRVKNKEYSPESYFLVIQLDDTDLNTEKAYSIVEDVRKYFMLPHVIILMAVNLTQLTYSIEQSYIAQFKIYEEHNKGNLINYHKMAIKYIDKLIPGRRKIFLSEIKPTTDEYGEMTTIEYIKKDEEKKEEKNILEYKDNNNNDIKDVQELVLRFIYEKTGLIFIKPKSYRHNIVPGTMRELVNFLSILNNMDNLKHDYTDEEDLRKRVNNITQFETYFTKTWVPNHVVGEYASIVQNLIDAPWTMKNKNTIREIKKVFYTTLQINNSKRATISGDIFSNIESKKKAQNNNTYSLADVREILYHIEDNQPSNDIYMLNFAINTIYSIYISRLICTELLCELNCEDYDPGALCSFLGGDIFGEKANEFIRKAENKYIRTSFEVRGRSSAKFEEEMKKSDNILFSAVFSNFAFPNSQYQGALPPYDVHYRAENSATSTVLNFNVTYPIFYMIQPRKLAERITDDSNDKIIESAAFEKAKTVRYICIQIISSLDIIHHLEVNLRNRYVTKSNSSWQFANYIKDFFDRIKKYIDTITYLPIKNNWSDFLDYIENHKGFLNMINELYVSNIDKESQQPISKLSTLRETKDRQNLSNKVKKIYNGLLNIMKKNPDVIDNEYKKKLETVKSVIDANKEMTGERIKELQMEVNTIVRDFNKKYVK